MLFNETGDGGNYDFVATQCQNSLKWLPAGSTQFAATPGSTAASSTPSMADELTKLAQLKASGALSEQEYQTAKAKVLGGQ